VQKLHIANPVSSILEHTELFYNEYMEKANKILIYRSEGGQVQLDVTLENESIWLNQEQIAKIFGVDRTSVAKHLRNIFKDRELKRKSTCAIFAHMVGNRLYKTQYYNLDVIISVGYRINSAKATKFRIWATNVLRDYIVKGYVVDEKKMLGVYKTQLKELKDLVDFIGTKADSPMLSGNEKSLIKFLQKYAKSIRILEEFDKGEFELLDYNFPKFEFSYENSLQIIDNLRDEVISQNPDNNLFGVDVTKKLSSIIDTINQTFDTKDLYGSIEEKAANLLYLIIKDHPFLDGNKRIASILFIYFLKQNEYLYDKSGKEKFNENSIVTLSLLVANSNPREKDVMVKLVIRLLQG
jgi:death-on-curing family protein